MKKILFIIISLLMMCTSVNAEWSSEENVLSLLNELKVMQGDGNGNYNLDSYVSRAECTKVVVSLSKSKDTIATGLKISPFSDVKYNQWHAPYIQAAVSGGLCEGYLDGSFKPDSRVKYEEAITMLLRALGYSNSDFGVSWPYGQIGMANSLGITENVDSQIGEELTRRQIARMAYNTLTSKQKDSNEKLLSVFDCEIKEDVTIISTSNENSSLGANKIYTSEGTFEIAGSFKSNYVGKKGDVVIKNGSKFLSFVPNEDSSADGLERYVVYSLLDNAVVCYKDGSFTQFDVKDTTVCYNDTNKSTYGSVKNSMEMGDIIYVSMDGSTVDYISFEKGSMVGPVKVGSTTWAESIGANSSTQYMRNGNKVSSSSEIHTNDIVYYSSELNMVMAYSDKITGIYESASPTRDAPSSVKISGKEYNIESVDAFNALSSSGSFKIGDTITVCLGKDGDIAGVVSSDVSTSTVGYVVDAGTKSFEDDNGNEYSSYYITMVGADGIENEYAVSNDCEIYIGSICTAVFKDGKTSVTKRNESGGITGTVDSSSYMIGSTKVDENVKIIDTAQSGNIDGKGSYVKTYLQRIDGITLNSDNVVYAKKNALGVVTELILKEATGDNYSYGIILSRTSSNDGYNNVLDLGGTTVNYNGVNLGATTTPIKCTLEGSKASNASQLRSYGSISEINGLEATVGSNTYKISDNVVVYYKKDSSEAMRITLDEAINGDYKLTAYYDKAETNGGRIRVIIAK